MKVSHRIGGVQVRWRYCEQGAPLYYNSSNHPLRAITLSPPCLFCKVSFPEISDVHAQQWSVSDRQRVASSVVSFNYFSVKHPY